MHLLPMLPQHSGTSIQGLLSCTHSSKSLLSIAIIQDLGFVPHKLKILVYLQDREPLEVPPSYPIILSSTQPSNIKSNDFSL